ncbi:MAG: Histone acetyltransferase HPA2 and related acetyltransferases [uncultured Solirubrobacterales bacterium]|uniref:Histone acetyltransferase HPA2 and related acetyltransferases n=1 Tax=uncultured Solirubrobacterales bacterium TaxID=768556 RepID=A0A6J4SXI9_9ACTN|nr:MAG: Histone acetyltransferase HPA2 and related acetyltransferases [uncultured Solirubrobacterales bacterium]
MPAASSAVEISSDPARLDRDLIHAFLSRESYWALGIAREVVDRAIEGSVPFGAYASSAQVGFARAVTDGATFAWVADVFVLHSHRGAGIGTRLVEAVLAHPRVSAARNVLLATADAHGVYSPHGFAPLPNPERYLSLRRAGREPFAPAPAAEA